MNIIFDIGNVICEWNPEKLINQVFEDPLQQQQAIKSVIQHKDWSELDKGLINVKQAVKNAAQRSGLEPDLLHNLHRQTPASLLPITATVKAISDLSDRGYSLYVLSNMQMHSWGYLSSKYDFWKCFKGIVVSYEVKLIKSDIAIFEYISNCYALERSDTIFLDDTLDNIDAANDFGLRTIHVREVSEAIAELYHALEI